MNTNSAKPVMNVAIAVINYHSQYLLAYRWYHQYQEYNYEFVGGKIEENETPLQAIIREVKEEIAVNLAENQCKFIDVIENENNEKILRLHVFFSSLNQAQFEQLKDKEKGELGQPLYWVAKEKIIDETYSLPKANAPILEWLKG